MVHLSLSSTAQLPDFKQTCLSLSSPPPAVFIFLSEQLALRPGMDSVASARLVTRGFLASSSSRTSTLPTLARIQARAPASPQVWTQRPGDVCALATHNAALPQMANMRSLWGVWPGVMFARFISRSDGRLDLRWLDPPVWVCVLGPQWRSPVPSCLAWASAAHKHSGASSAPGCVDIRAGEVGSWFQSPWKATSERASVQTGDDP